MFSKKSLIILLALSCVLFATLFFNRDENAYEVGYTSGLFMPGLKDKLGDVAKIQIESVGESVEIVNLGGQWIVGSKQNYPADANAIRQLIYGMAELDIVETKTDDESLLSKIGLTQDSEDSVRITLTDAGDETISDILFGISQAVLSGQGQAWFVRHFEDNQSWLVNGKLPLNRSAYQWLNKTVLTLQPDEIVQVILNAGDKDSVVIEKSDESQLFELQGLTEAEDVVDYKIDDIVTSASAIQLDDVRQNSTESKEANDPATVQLKTNSGLLVDIRIIDPEEGWVQLTADTETDDQGVSEQSQTLNNKWSAWEFKIPNYKLESLMQNRQDLIEQKDSS